MLYDIGYTENQAYFITRELKRMCVSDLVDDPKNTQYLIGVRKHRDRDEHALEFPEADVEMPLILNNNIEYSISTLMALFDSDLTEQEKTDKANLVRARKASGQKLLLSEIIPQAVFARLKTREELDADGWFIEEII